ncbi:MAG TPA: type II secretion system protein GspG [Vicinamibacterales bacterium]|nr:type II secretion system protein GspG [Vicinamibacterales bacterium]
MQVRAGVWPSRTTGEEGLSLIETAIVMIVAASIIGALAPSLAAVRRHAEIAAATTQMGRIRDAILQALDDLNYQRFTIDGTQNGTRVRRLVSDGDIPRDRSTSLGNAANWQAVVDNATGLTDFLERHLVTNDPRGSSANDYPTAGGDRWRGPYLNPPVDPDPWGNRYAVNVEYLGGGAGGTNDVVVYSAGPDEEIDSAYTGNPLNPGDDDLMVLVES